MNYQKYKHCQVMISALRKSITMGILPDDPVFRQEWMHYLRRLDAVCKQLPSAELQLHEVVPEDIFALVQQWTQNVEPDEWMDTLLSIEEENYQHKLIREFFSYGDHSSDIYKVSGGGFSPRHYDSHTESFVRFDQSATSGSGYYYTEYLRTPEEARAFLRAYPAKRIEVLQFMHTTLQEASELWKKQHPDLSMEQKVAILCQKVREWFDFYQKRGTFLSDALYRQILKHMEKEMADCHFFDILARL